MGSGMGLIICILVPVVLLLFGILDIVQTASGILLLCGLWAIVYGVAFGKIADRLYDVGAGVVVIAISTFVVLPLQYVAGLVLISIIAIVLTSIAMPRKKVKTTP
jgi:predicted MFS family arabinose efflux permease